MTIKKSINVVVSKKTRIGAITSDTPVTIKNMPTLESGVNTLDELKDVQLGLRTDGSVPIYDQPTNTYVVKHIDFNEIDGDLDGGIF